MKRILVTGGAGFIGSHLCEALLDNDLEVIALDNLYSGSHSNIQEFLTNPKFSFINHDITEYIFTPVDLIINLACPASPVYYQKDPVSTVRTSVLGAINVLTLAKNLNVPVLQASTSEVYGDPLVSPQDESYLGNVNPIGIRACYDEGKRVAETLMYDYSRQYGVQIKIARIFNTYGPRMSLDDGRVVTNFIGQALRNRPITVYGDGLQTRSFCYVDDLIEGISLLFDSEVGITGPINIGNPVEITMLQLADTIIKLTGSKSQIKFEPLPENDPKQRCPDITIAREILGWTPKVKLHDGLLNTIGFLSKQMN
jgi:UDP-glucuronate decarboxylase